MAGNRTYHDFEPVSEWKHENDNDTLNLYLPEFKKDLLRVQVSNNGTLRISGERPLGGNKWTRFTKEFPVTSNCDINKLSAKFQGGILSVRQPKRITPIENKPQPPQKTTPSPPPPPTELHKGNEQKPQKTNQETAQSAKNPSDEPLKQETAKSLNKEKDKESRTTFGDLVKKERDADKVQETGGAKEEDRKENEKVGKIKNRDENKKSMVKLGHLNRRWITLVLVVLFSILVGLHLKNGKFFERIEN